MKMAQNLKILIDSLPSDKLTTDAYRVAETPIPNIGDNEVLVKTTAVAITAGTRAGLQGSASYAGAPKTGIVMNGTGEGEVAASNSAEFSVGEAVMAPTGWQSYSAHLPAALSKIPPEHDPVDYLGPLGVNGLTAYFGLFNIGRPKAGETVMVSAAAGSVGHMVGQMAKISDTRVVGVCGSDAKALTLTDALGFDAVVNYKEDDFRQALKAATPDGVDVYFDNTGGDILGSALRRLNVGGRIACCGVVSQYDTGNPAPGPRGIPGLLINKRIHMCGFLVFDFADQYADARAQISQWLASGQLKHLIDEVTGLEAAPGAFVDLLAGGNVGTRVVRVS
jgi:NADPH-dependent curcumin reductase CurA